MTSSPRHYQYYLVMGPDFYGSVQLIPKAPGLQYILLKLFRYLRCEGLDMFRFILSILSTSLYCKWAGNLEYEEDSAHC